MRQPKTRGEPLSSAAPVLALQPLEPACGGTVETQSSWRASAT
jgi:hypothetical protein